MVKKSNYREPPTPSGLEKIEKGTLDYFDIETYSNLNTGVMEEYLDEKTRKEGFGKLKWNWGQVAIGMFIGTIFAVITEYVGLKVGMAISGGWYLAYLLGMALKWKPQEINLMAASCDAATTIATGFIFTFPAMYLLKYTSDFAIGTDPLTGGPRFLITSIPPVAVPLLATIVSGWLGVMYFILFRRLWLIDDPLHVPGFEPTVKLLDIAKDMSGGAIAQAKRSIKIMMQWFSISAIFTFLRDLPLIHGTKDGVTANWSVLDWAMGGKYYLAGEVMQDTASAKFTFVSFAILPIQIGIGWFMKFRVALLMSMGSFLTWFIIIPLAVGLHTPIYLINYGPFQINGFVDVASIPFASWIAYRKIGTIIGIGAILGGGILAIVKMVPTFGKAFKDVSNALKGGKSSDYEEGKGWYEWPMMHLVVMLIVAFIMVSIIFTAGGYNPGASVVFAGVLCLTTFFLGAIAVKTMGETGTEPVSATSILVLLFLIGVFMLVGLPPAQNAVMAIIGTTVFAGAISMSGSITIDYKVSIYVGNRPYHMMKAVLTSLIPGAIVGAIGAGFLAYGLATGKLNLLAPQAKVFATLMQIIFSGASNGPLLSYIGIGAFIGIVVELLTGMGTAFGLGMYFPLSIQLPMLFGGALRDFWEQKFLEPKAKRERWNETTKTLKLLDSFMAATGLMIGEAIMATIAAVVMVATT